MELPKEYFDTYNLMEFIMKKIWESYRGGIAGCKISFESIKLNIDDIKRSIQKLDDAKREDRQEYVIYCNELKRIYNELVEVNKYSLREFIDRLNCESLGIEYEELKTMDKDKPVFSLDEEPEVMTEDETQALLNDLQEEKRETVYPTQNVDQLFEPLKFSGIPSDNPIQPSDLETYNNYPR